VADLTEVTFRPNIRSFIRAGVRSSMTRDQILDGLEDRFLDENGTFRGVSRQAVNRMIGQETDRQGVIDRINRRDFRERTNLHSLVGCGAGETIQTRISLTWRDTETGVQRTYGHTTTLDNSGRFMDILNKALREAMDDARNRGYTPPHITSSMLAGSTRYRLEYVECV
jgi:hypothetical protein